MAEYIIDKMEYNNEIYEFQDTTSGYTTATIINLLYPVGSYRNNLRS